MSKKGFTLAEVLIGIFILSLIALFFFNGAAQQFRLVSQTSVRSYDLFNASTIVETNIDEIKDAIDSGGPLPPPSIRTLTFTDSTGAAFQRDVRYFPISRYVGQDSATAVGQQNRNRLVVYVANERR